MEGMEILMASQMQNAVMSTTQNIKQVPEVSRTKIDDILTLLRAVQNQVSGLPDVVSSKLWDFPQHQGASQPSSSFLSPPKFGYQGKYWKTLQAR